ncbi:CpaD family pilus assembly protein [Hyphomonas johnsonii]|nr:CpaD family pilus assembly protein [Hyphomonas johnsonii]
MMKPTSMLLAAAGLGIASLTGCASTASTKLPPVYLQGTVLDNHQIGVSKRTEFLEIAISPVASEITLKDRQQIADFVTLYRKRGHGPLIMSLPESSANPQLAVSAVATAREIAWQNGVEYDEIAGSSHGEGSTVSEPLLMAFQVYDAVAPDCKPLSEYDYSDVSSNNESPELGCAVRTNLAAMIADPADLLGQRKLDAADGPRRAVILEKFRNGEATASTRGRDESGAVSQAVGN